MSEDFPKHILDHYRKPRNYGEIKDANVIVKDSNKLCGDYVEIYLKFDGNRISAISFKGQGCMISQASASMLTELVKDKEVEEVLKLTKNDVMKMLGLELGPVKMKCAMLPLVVLRKGIESYLKSQQV
ncbi:MAG: SUF system NifU family Fe-S cluster assembly protein [Nitrososphaerota archaeon]